MHNNDYILNIEILLCLVWLSLLNLYKQILRLLAVGSCSGVWCFFWVHENMYVNAVIFILCKLILRFTYIDSYFLYWEALPSVWLLAKASVCRTANLDLQWICTKIPFGSLHGMWHPHAPICVRGTLFNALTNSVCLFVCLLK